MLFVGVEHAIASATVNNTEMSEALFITQISFIAEA
jgi:hypothetical protein